ncbi:hypothetical protein ABZ953_10390 [Streptomyces sp. NPDC046465]|uniref:hypothetical protein n=1 Tax=Streptomyces sp. NPDC046465 TaxID=3155810 RepID=UPI00340546C3
MTTSSADALARHAGRLLCWHLALAMVLTASLGLHPYDRLRPALYVLWAALPLTAAAWALARAHQKRRLRQERSRHTAQPDDWTPAA